MYIPILLTVCNNISMKNVIKCVESINLLNVKVLNQLNKECCTGILTMV